MALTPPNNNEGNKTETWSLVLATNNQIIDRSDMPNPSTVEYKGYYKAEATGMHKFSLNGTSNDITGYSWVSSAPANSDHIKRNNRGARLVFNNSFAIQIPVKNRFKNESILGGLDFPGYGYWPKFKSGGPGVELQYGNLQGFNYIYSGRDAPSTDCSHNQVGHQYLVPGDVRTYGVNEFPKFAGRPAGPGWQAPEDPNFSAPCWPSEYARPLVAVDNTLIPDQVDNFAVSTTQGRKSQITLDNGFIAGGSENYAKFQRVAVDENNPDHIYIWPMAIPKAALEPPWGEIWNKITEPQRIQIRFGVMFRQETQDYTFEWKSRDGLKMWYRLSQPNDNRYFQKFPTTAGNNPCNFTAQYTGNSGWLPGGGFDGFTGKLKIKQNTWVVFNGFGVGDPGDETHGFSIVIKNSNGDIVFDSTDLLDRGGKIGIDECGYHALLNDESRLPGNRVAEFYDNDGWNGIDNDIFTADSVVGDNNERDPSTTRQYLWSNALTSTRDGTNTPGDVFLRQGDYYFIRTIVSSNVQNGGFTFKVTTPIGESKSVMFSGNSNPGSDTSVGGSYGGAGIAKNKLCDSILFNNGVAISDNTNFAVVDKMGVVLNLDLLGLSSYDIGKEGQDEEVNDTKSEGSAELVFKFNTLYPTIKITLDELVRDGGQEISTDKERSWIVINEYIKQKDANLTMEYSEFVGAINNQAVMRWGSGGNYQYVYHAVSVIIESICNGTEITQTDTSGVNGDSNNNNNNVGEPTCIEIDVTNIAGGAGLITSECLDECKHPKDYPALSTEYQKYKLNYVNSDSSYYDSIVIEKDATLYYKGPDKDAPNGGKNSLFQSRIDNGIRFEPGKVTSIPFTVPDYYEPDWINSAVASKLNSFYVDIDSANIIGDWEPGSEPGLLVWWSTYAGGPALGNPYLLAGIIDGTEVFATFSPFILNKYPDTNIVGYLGNKYGTRWINFTTFNRDLTTSTSINDLEIGSTAFMARMSSLGLAMKDKFSLSMQIPVPDCTKTNIVSARTITNSNNTMRSLPNMNSYIGPEWDGTLPSYVTIATNGGGIWGGNSDYLPDPGLNPSNGTRKLYTPLEGKIVAYAFTVNSSQKFNRNVNVFGQTPPGGNPLGSCSPALSSVVWWSATPGGEPLKDWRGQTSNVQRIGEAQGDPRIDMVQAYDIQDVSKAEFNNVGLIPVISKTYYFNYAVVEQSIAIDCKTNKRIPVPSELRPFDPKACDPTDIQPKPYTVTGFNFSPVDFDTWLQENTQ